MSALLAGLFITPASAVAASGTYPTEHNTGWVTCTIDTFTNTQTLSVKPGTMGPTNSFYGKLRTWSWVQYSFDGRTWANWYATATRSATINGYGALNPPADTRTFGFGGGRPFVIRVMQAYEWYNASGARIGSTKWLVVDHYESRIKTASDPSGIFGRTTGSGGCVFG